MCVCKGGGVPVCPYLGVFLDACKFLFMLVSLCFKCMQVCVKPRLRGPGERLECTAPREVAHVTWVTSGTSYV